MHNFSELSGASNPFEQLVMSCENAIESFWGKGRRTKDFLNKIKTVDKYTDLRMLNLITCIPNTKVALELDFATSLYFDLFRCDLFTLNNFDTTKYFDHGVDADLSNVGAVIINLGQTYYRNKLANLFFYVQKIDNEQKCTKCDDVQLILSTNLIMIIDGKIVNIEEGWLSKKGKIFCSYAMCNDYSCTKCNLKDLTLDGESIGNLVRAKSKFQGYECPTPDGLKPESLLNVLKYVLYCEEHRHALVPTIGGSISEKQIVRKIYEVNPISRVNYESNKLEGNLRKDSISFNEVPLQHLVVTERKEWQGGHHASPRPHERRSTFVKVQKGSKAGTHVWDEDHKCFVKVEKGTGTHFERSGSFVNQSENSGTISRAVTKINIFGDV